MIGQPKKGSFIDYNCYTQSNPRPSRSRFLKIYVFQPKYNQFQIRSIFNLFLIKLNKFDHFQSKSPLKDRKVD